MPATAPSLSRGLGFACLPETSVSLPKRLPCDYLRDNPGLDVSLRPHTYARPMPGLNKDSVEEDLASVMRQGIKSFTFDNLVALQSFAVLTERQSGRKHLAKTDYYPSPNRLRHYIMAFLAECQTVERRVGTALFGADPYTAELEFQARQLEAGRRYNPSRPVSVAGIRKKPYGQQWKLIRKLAERLIAYESAQRTEEAKSEQEFLDDQPSNWDPVASRSRWPRPLPPLPHSHLWEHQAGYRWLDYHAHLECSADYLQLAVTTKVHIEVLNPGMRTYYHMYEPLSHRYPHHGASAPIVDFPTELPDHPNPPHSVAPAEYVGGIAASPRHPTWVLDYFDLGIGLQQWEVVHIVFRHTYV